MQFDMLPGECWWGGCVNQGHEMPLTQESDVHMSPVGGHENDQFAPLFVSSAGRYLWSERPFELWASAGKITCAGSGDVLLSEGHGSLRGAYLAACRAHFPFTGALPEKAFFTSPQYNTWIELGTNQTQEAILRYAEQIVAHGLPAGILMIDDGWQEDYGVFEFHLRKIPRPQELIDRLHALGFQVMLWVTPMVGCAGDQFKLLRDRGFLIRDANGEVAVRSWRNGYSAVLDLTNPEAVAWYHQQLRGMMARYHVDGFKFDAGDAYFYRDDDRTFAPMTAREHARTFNEVGVCYPLNEFRAAWKFGGQPIVARLHDKYHTWDDFGLNTLIPHTIVQGLLGYAYCCPDMVGGGIIASFAEGKPLDEELFVRWAQANIYMGMMQMSIAPWRVLSAESAELVLEALKKHARLGETMLALARNAAKTGEPVVRHMAYVFPGEGFERCDTQFMLGDDLLVAPVLEKGATTRRVQLPRGSWRAWTGEVYEGGVTIELPVTIRDVPTFERVGE